MNSVEATKITKLDASLQTAWVESDFGAQSSADAWGPFSFLSQHLLVAGRKLWPELCPGLCRAPSGGRRRLQSAASHRRILKFACVGSDDFDASFPVLTHDLVKPSTQRNWG